MGVYFDGKEKIAMFTLLVMVVLIIVAGWLDARLNWQQAGSREKEPVRK